MNPFQVVAIWFGMEILESKPNLLFVQNPDRNWNDSVQHFRNQLKELKENTFPNQDKTTWTKIGSGLRSIMTPEPPQPAVLLFAHDSETEKIAECLAEKVAQIGVDAMRLSDRVRVRLHKAEMVKERNGFYDMMERDLKVGNDHNLNFRIKFSKIFSLYQVMQ